MFFREICFILWLEAGLGGPSRGWGVGGGCSGSSWGVSEGCGGLVVIIGGLSMQPTIAISLCSEGCGGSRVIMGGGGGGIKVSLVIIGGLPMQPTMVNCLVSSRVVELSGCGVGGCEEGGWLVWFLPLLPSG